MSAERASIDFGSKLREARERRGVTLRQIANSTKISFGQLESLERNDISKLPGGIFSRAFVRSYAVEVGLDPEATIQEFIAQFPHDSVTIGHPASGQIDDNEAMESDRRIARALLWLIAIGVPVAAAVLYFGLSGRRVTPQAAAPSPAVAVPAPSMPGPATTVSSANELPASEAPAPRVADAPVVPAGAVTERQAAAVAPAATTIPNGDVLLVALAVRRPCWVSASVDGQKVIERLLQAGEQRALEVRRELVITAGDASAIALTFNGADARPLGKAGEVVTARFSPANFTSYLQAR